MNYIEYLSLTREQLRDKLGEPDDFGGTSCKYPTPSVYLYGDVEYHFTPWKNGTVIFIMEASTHKILAEESNGFRT